MQVTDWLGFLAEIADRADAIALRLFRSQDLHVEEKADRSLVTQADREIEAAARALLGQRHPELGILGEELGSAAGSSDSRLVIDPIDATFNFVRGVPVFATLLAIERAGEVVAGLVSAPALGGARWHAARGAGAWEGKHRLRVSGVRELAHAQLFHGSIGGYEGVRTPPGLVELARVTHRQRGFGDFWQHCLVAAGSGEIACDPIVQPWDIAALQVLVEEAGGRATALDGQRSIYAGSLVSTNGHLHEAALERLRGR
ncbi:MAG TPA: inositol monophosphatase family protein [Myxococcota bacterium]|nr:inositol monophosphatase family protein [Myxococcota bacterium]